MNKSVNLIKRFCVLLIKGLYVGCFFATSIVLLQMLYFPQDASETSFTATEWARNEEMIKKIVNHEQQVPSGHFHITDEYVFRLEPDPPICFTCHGIYPHIKEEKTMSFLNLHVGFMACEVCHIRTEERGREHHFTWVNLETGAASMQAKGGYGKYAAKIVPVKSINGHLERLDKLISEKFMEMYLELKKKQYASGQRAKVEKVHGKHLSEKPVSCLECHKKYGYLDWKKLGFQQRRINQLSSSEVSRMVEHYETFYLPKMLIMQ
jgi:hypothetical protein